MLFSVHIILIQNLFDADVNVFKCIQIASQHQLGSFHRKLYIESIKSCETLNLATNESH